MTDFITVVENIETTIEAAFAKIHSQAEIGKLGTWASVLAIASGPLVKGLKPGGKILGTVASG
ncbi:hypothetical protein [Solibacillus ferritrahens]|uniref:hypothetical protein n=1 Tax=Solibacillus ferritrahens TaxID=3098620 RepID=UPI003009C74D